MTDRSNIPRFPGSLKRVSMQSLTVSMTCSEHLSLLMLFYPWRRRRRREREAEKKKIPKNFPSYPLFTMGPTFLGSQLPRTRFSVRGLRQTTAGAESTPQRKLNRIQKDTSRRGHGNCGLPNKHVDPSVMAQKFLLVWSLGFAAGLADRNRAQEASKYPLVTHYGSVRQRSHHRESSKIPMFMDDSKPTPKRLVGRHVCTQNKVVMKPVKHMESYCKPSYKSYMRRCDHATNSYCTGYRVMYELAYRMVEKLVAHTETSYSCCPGWAQKSWSPECKIALCPKKCQNGGTCVKPSHCLCPPGWSGKYCEADVDECRNYTRHCEHDCINTKGSYRCTCKAGFRLLTDGRTCRPETSVHDKSPANYPRDIDEIKRRLDRLEQNIVSMQELRHRFENLSQTVKLYLETKPLRNHVTPKGGRRDAESGDQTRVENRQPDVDGIVATETAEDRINSLSEQMAILEERLADCTCVLREEVPLPPPAR